MPATLDDLLTPERLRLRAGPAAYERGERYASEGAVESLSRHEGRIVAQVEGDSLYDVEIRAEDGELATRCTCPAARSGAVCKHVVAVGLAALAGRGAPEPPEVPQPEPTLEDVRRRLMTAPRERVVEEILQAAASDERLRERLLLRVSVEGGAAPDIGALARAIDRVTGGRRFIPYGEATAFARRIDDTIDGIEALLDGGHAADVVGLCERMLGRLERVMMRMDDSDGHLSALRDRVQEIHLRACGIARPDPEKLAERLFRTEMTTDLDVFYRAAERYAAVLGARGLATYRRLAEAHWANVPARGPGDPRDREPAADFVSRFRITSVMESLARAAGDVEGLVAILSRDLSSAHAFERVVEVYVAAGQPELALSWAERGLRAFPAAGSGALGSHVMDRYQAGGRHDEAMAIEWATFERGPGLSTFERLLLRAERAGARVVWRERAMALLRSRVAAAASAPAQSRWAHPGAFERASLVQALLHEGDVEAAWAEATSGPCDLSFRVEVARRREASHPLDAVGVYREQVEAALDRRSNHSYEEAVGVLRRTRRLLEAAGQADDFAPYVAKVRATHRAKRNFIALLDKAGWPK